MNNKPVVLVSKCLGFSDCRYNGGTSKDDFIELLKNFVEFKTVCPEVEIGLGTPREAIRLVEVEGLVKVIQGKNKVDLTEKMNLYTKRFVENLKNTNLDGVILKSRSPSCGVKDVKIYASSEKGSSSKKGVGIFANEILNAFKNYPIEDDGRLKDFKLREVFLTKLFVSFKLKEILHNYSYEEFSQFHNKNKLLFTMYNKSKAQLLENLFDKLNKNSNEESNLLRQYYENTNLLFNRAARCDNRFNLLLHLNNRYKEKIKNEEYEFIKKCIDNYRMGHLPFNNPLNMIRELSIRFEDEDIINQTLFCPFPEELVNMRDSGKVVL